MYTHRRRLPFRPQRDLLRRRVRRGLAPPGQDPWSFHNITQYYTYIYTCVYVCVYIYIYTHIHIHIHINILNSQTPTCTVMPLASLLIRLGGFLRVLVPKHGTNI